jgi:hypothetical protein
MRLVAVTGPDPTDTSTSRRRGPYMRLLGIMKFKVAALVERTVR